MTYCEVPLFNGSDFVKKKAESLPFKPREVKIAGKRLETTPVFDAYWRFAAKRQRIFYRKLRDVDGTDSRFTSDPILAEYKFTNAYRASDRVSQYLIRRVIYGVDLPDDAENVFFRIILFKLFNSIETWEAMETALGRITLARYSFHEFDELLSARQDAGERNYSAAYVMPSAGGAFGCRRKHSNHLRLLEWMLEKRFPARLRQCVSMADGFRLFAGAPSIGPFLAYQFITDVNYSLLTNHSESEFVVAGPGALDGISKCFVASRGVPAAEIISHMASHQQYYFDDLDIRFNDLWGRELQLIDCQNLFCEISKYARIAFPEIGGTLGRKRIKQKYRSRGRPNTPWYPPKWGINDKIGEEQSQFFVRTSDNASAVQYTLL